LSWLGAVNTIAGWCGLGIAVLGGVLGRKEDQSPAGDKQTDEGRRSA
jgi:hypothetical protein